MSFLCTMDGHFACLPDAESITLFNDGIVGANVAVYRKDEKAFVRWVEGVGQILPLFEISQREFGILVDPAMFLSFLSGNDGLELVFPPGFWEAAGLVPWIDVLQLGLDPNL